MSDNISSNEFMFFKNEVLGEFKKIEQRFSKTLEEQNDDLLKKVTKSEQRVRLLQDKLLEISEAIENHKNLKIEIKPLLEMKNKFDDTILTIETKLDSMDRDMQTSFFKYDSLFNNGFLIPGLIGNACKFPSMKSFLEYSNKILSDYTVFKEKQILDLKNYKDKLENLIKQFKLQNENSNNTFINHCKKILKECKESFEERVKITEEKLDNLRVENNRYSNDLLDATKKIKLDWDNLDSYKKEINDKFDNNEKNVKQFHDNIIKQFENAKNDNLLVKQKFTNLSEFIKDVRFRRNIGQTVKRREFKDMSKKIDFTRKQKLENVDYQNELNFYDEFLLKLKDEFGNDEIVRNNKNKTKTQIVPKNDKQKKLMDVSLHLKDDNSEEDEEEEEEIHFNNKQEETENKLEFLSEDEKESKLINIEYEKKGKNKVKFSDKNNLNSKINPNIQILRHHRTKTQNVTKRKGPLLPNMNKKKFLLPENIQENSVKDENNNNIKNISFFQSSNENQKVNSYFNSYEIKNNNRRNSFLNAKNYTLEHYEKQKDNYPVIFTNKTITKEENIDNNKIYNINSKIKKIENHIIELENSTQKKFEQILAHLKRLINNKISEETIELNSNININDSDNMTKNFSNTFLGGNKLTRNKNNQLYVSSKNLSLKMNEKDTKKISSFHSRYNSEKINNQNKNNKQSDIFKPFNSIKLINKIEPYLIKKFKDN